jgi:hypothetical protein
VGATGEAVVLRCDDDAVRGALEHRVVRAAVGRTGACTSCAGREREQLVAEADPEDRDASDQSRIVACSSFRGSGSPGPFDEQNAVVVEELVRVHVVRVDRDRRALTRRAGSGSTACSRSR